MARQNRRAQASLDERLCGPDLIPVRTDAEIVQRRSDRMVRADCGEGNWVLFEEVLALYGLTLSRAREVVGSVQLANPRELPTWVERLKEGLTEAAAKPQEEGKSRLA